MALGLQSIYNFVQENNLVSEHYSAGFRHLTPELAWYSVCVSFIAFPCDALLLSLMADDRVVMQQDELKEAFGSEQQWVSELPAEIWDRLVAVVGSPLEGQDLRNAVLHSVHVSWGYMVAKVFEVLEDLPWRLARHNLTENLRSLLDGDEQKEPISRKIRCLHQLGPL